MARIIRLKKPEWDKFSPFGGIIRSKNWIEICQASAKADKPSSRSSYVSFPSETRTQSDLKGPKLTKIRPFWAEIGPQIGPNFYLSDHRSELSGSKILKLYNSRLWREISPKAKKTCPCNLYTVNDCVWNKISRSMILKFYSVRKSPFWETHNPRPSGKNWLKNLRFFTWSRLCIILGQVFDLT